MIGKNFSLFLFPGLLKTSPLSANISASAGEIMPAIDDNFSRFKPGNSYKFRWSFFSKTDNTGPFRSMSQLFWHKDCKKAPFFGIMKR